MSLRKVSIRVHASRGRGLAALGLALAVALVAGCSSIKIPVAAGQDARTVVHLAPAEREHLRVGMRKYLESVRGIVDALASGKTARAVESASASGMSAVSDLPIALVAKLPPEFTMMSVDTHQKFDALAAAARQSRDRTALLKQLDDILGNCTTCHASYRIATP